MLNIQKVLLTTDFSESARKAMVHAAELAGRSQAELIILHVRTLFQDDPNNPEHQFLDQERYDRFVAESLDQAAESLGSRAQVRREVRRNVSPAAGILDFCAEQGVDLVVMGTHGRSAIGHFFLGSVAERVVRHAPCPVLTVGSGHKPYKDNPLYRKILVAFDFSEHSIDAAGKAIDVAALYDARVKVFYALEQEVHPAFFATWKMSIEHHLDEIADNANRALREALGEEAVANLDIQVQIGDDRSDKEIAELAEKEQFDLVVLGTHGLSGLDRALLGSTTERVLRIAPCPVLTFKLDH